MPGSDTGAREGHECLGPGLLCWMAARFRMQTFFWRSDNERALLAFLRAAAASLEGVEVIEQASPEEEHAANGIAEVSVREVKAQTRLQKIHLEETLMRQLDWSEPLATWLFRHSASRWEEPGSGARRKTLETSRCQVWRESSILTCRGSHLVG